jgi:acetyl-CoA carboxylase carboxyl transferase subunit beta
VSPSRRWSARQLLELVLDAGSYESWDVPVSYHDQPEPYRAQQQAAAVKAGTDEAVITGRGCVRGRPVAVIVSEFAFLAGSIGCATADRIAAAVRRATAERLPILASTASGGTRMQEGTPAFVKMIDICRALVEHKSARLPYLVHLRHPTTGGVYASWGSLGHITVAEPGALVAFLGPRVYEALKQEPFPEGVQTAENLAAVGVIDAVVSVEELPILVDRALAVLVDPPSREPIPASSERSATASDAWEAIRLTRRPGRASVRDLLRYGASGTLRLRGTDEGQRDQTMLVALTRIAGHPCVFAGQDRTRQTLTTPMGPAALREARRAMRLAEELGLPMITVIDTPGAELSPRAEEGAIAGEIARCIATLATLTVPTISVLLGQGCGGGALALLPARHVIATGNAWLAPLPPEGASAIVHGDVEHAAEMARSQRVTASELQEQGTVHHVIWEGHRTTPRELAEGVSQAIGVQLADDAPISSSRARRVEPQGSGTLR